MGTPIVYTAEHAALAALEILNAWQRYTNLNAYTLYLARIDPDVVANAVPELAAARVSVSDQHATRALGDEWYAARRSVALRVPSLAAPASYNYLLNPDHPEFEKAVARETLGPCRYDERIMDLVHAAKGPLGPRKT